MRDLCINLENYGVKGQRDRTYLRYIILSFKDTNIELWVFEESGRVHAIAERGNNGDRLGAVTTINLEDPGADKKYYIMLKGADIKGQYLNYVPSENSYYMGDYVETSRIKTQFTKRDIVEYELQAFAHNELFELVEVEE